jgi:hypothetical protein
LRQRQPNTLKQNTYSQHRTPHPQKTKKNTRAPKKLAGDNDCCPGTRYEYGCATAAAGRTVSATLWTEATDLGGVDKLVRAGFFLEVCVCLCWLLKGVGVCAVVFLCVCV